MCIQISSITVVRLVNRKRFWSTPLPALTGADLEGTMEEDIMGEDILGDIMASRHTVGTAVFLPRLTASCPAMESSVRNIARIANAVQCHS